MGENCRHLYVVDRARYIHRRRYREPDRMSTPSPVGIFQHFFSSYADSHNCRTWDLIADRPRTLPCLGV